MNPRDIKRWLLFLILVWMAGMMLSNSYERHSRALRENSDTLRKQTAVFDSLRKEIQKLDTGYR